MADKVPWDVFEAKYAGLFPRHTGNVAKPLRMALGFLMIQNRYQLSDRELVEQIMENPYYQYFIAPPGYQDNPPFDTSTLVLFRKRITADMFNEANEYLPAVGASHSEGKSKGANGIWGKTECRHRGRRKWAHWKEWERRIIMAQTDLDVLKKWNNQN